MDDRARATYRAIGWAFVGVAAGVIGIRIGEVVFGFAFFRGSPLPTALFLAAIGGLLVWTVRGAGDGDATTDRSSDAAPAPFRLEDLGSVRPSGGAVDGIPPEPIRREVDGEGGDGGDGGEGGDGADLAGDDERDRMTQAAGRADERGTRSDERRDGGDPT